MRREGKTLKLSAALLAELQPFVRTFYGENLSEVITFALRQWVESHKPEAHLLKRPNNEPAIEDGDSVIDTTSN